MQSTEQLLNKRKPLSCFGHSKALIDGGAVTYVIIMQGGMLIVIEDEDCSLLEEKSIKVTDRRAFVN